MTIEIVVPQVGEAISAARLVEWYKKEGDEVRLGEPLFAVDTDKAVLDVEAFQNGVLEKILVEEDSEVQPEMVVGLMSGGAGEEQQAAVSAAEAAAAEGAGEETRAASLPDAERRDGRRSPAADVGRGSISPRARRLAEELGLDVAAIADRLGGRMVSERDIRAAAEEVRGQSEGDGGKPSDGSWTAFTPMRQAIAEKTQRSKQEVPHFYLMADVDMTQAIRLRSASHAKPSFTALIAKACAGALQEMPEANIRYEKGGLRRRDTIDIGVAAAVDGGVATVVVPKADSLSLLDIDARLKAIRKRLEAGKFRPSDLGERSLTVSNLGMHAVDAFVAVIDPPDAAILAAGAIADRVVARDGKAAVRPICSLTLSVDHRVLDGVSAARLLNLIRSRLEDASSDS